MMDFANRLKPYEYAFSEFLARPINVDSWVLVNIAQLHSKQQPTHYILKTF